MLHLSSSFGGSSMAVSHVECTNRNVSQPRVALMAAYGDSSVSSCCLLAPEDSLAFCLSSCRCTKQVQLIVHILS